MHTRNNQNIFAVRFLNGKLLIRRLPWFVYTQRKCLSRKNRKVTTITETQRAAGGGLKKNTHTRIGFLHIYTRQFTHCKPGGRLHTRSRKGNGKRKVERGRGGLSVCLFVNSMSERVSGLFCKLCVSQTAACCLVNMQTNRCKSPTS